jgi:hypothetical protein
MATRAHGHTLAQQGYVDKDLEVGGAAGTLIQASLALA